RKRLLWELGLARDQCRGVGVLVIRRTSESELHGDARAPGRAFYDLPVCTARSTLLATPRTQHPAPNPALRTQHPAPFRHLRLLPQFGHEFGEQVPQPTELGLAFQVPLHVADRAWNVLNGHRVLPR